MKIRQALCSLLFLSLVYTTAQSAPPATDKAADKWVTSTSKAGKYKIQLPGKPTNSVQAVKTAVGEVKIYMSILELDKGKSAITIFYNDYPKGTVTKENVATILKGAVNGAVTSKRGKIKSSVDIKIGEHPGKQVHFTFMQGGKEISLKGRFYVVNDRLYQLLAVQGAGSTFTDKDLKKFYDSFELDKWVTSTSKAGKYKIQLPGKPTDSVQAVKTAVGEIKMHMSILELDKGNSAITIFYNDYPKGSVTKENVATILQGAVDGAVNSKRGKIKSSVDIKIGEHPGKQVHFTFMQGGKEISLKGRFYVVNDRLYQLLAVQGAGSTFTDKDLKKFYDSFELVK